MMLSTVLLIVAEKNRFWRCAGMASMMRFTSGQNPMSSMRSASSRTSVSTLSSRTSP